MWEVGEKEGDGRLARGKELAMEAVAVPVCQRIDTSSGGGSRKDGMDSDIITSTRGGLHKGEFTAVLNTCSPFKGILAYPSR